MDATVPSSAVIIPLPVPSPDRAARLARVREAVAEAASWYAGGLPPDRPWPA
ncbi:MAG TPA: hypothetical protein VFQ68_42105 [Streptosporangiaceae bacterium]|nr:hypothetical protein [Streptosporangiaceae bacterium]